MKANIGISYGSIYYQNLGCGALTYSTLQILREIENRFEVKLEYTLRENYDSRYLYMPKELKSYPIKFIEKHSLPRTILKNLANRKFSDLTQLKELKSCDIFLDVVGGDSFSDTYGIDRIIRLYHDFKRIKRTKRKIILLPQTIGPFSSEKAIAMARSILNQADYVYARDKISYDEACRLTNPDKVELAVDMALYMDYYPRKRNKNRKEIGINASGLLWNGGYQRNNQFKLKNEYQDTLRALIQHLQKYTNFHIKLIPHVLTGNYSFNIEDDYHACRELKNEFPECELAPFFYTPIEAKSYISGLDALIGSRMHCCVAGFSSGVPIFPLAYSRKFHGMFKETLGYEHGADLQSERTEGILSKVQKFIENLDLIQNEMSHHTYSLEGSKNRFISSLGNRILSIAKN